MPQQLLDRPDVGPGLQQVRGEGMAQCVDRYRLGDAGLKDCALERALQALLVQVMAANDAGFGMDGKGGRREQPEPDLDADINPQHPYLPS